jgi:hypothetical protein
VLDGIVDLWQKLMSSQFAAISCIDDELPAGAVVLGLPFIYTISSMSNQKAAAVQVIQ